VERVASHSDLKTTKTAEAEKNTVEAEKQTTTPLTR